MYGAVQSSRGMPFSPARRAGCMLRQQQFSLCTRVHKKTAAANGSHTEWAVCIHAAAAPSSIGPAFLSDCSSSPAFLSGCSSSPAPAFLSGCHFPFKYPFCSLSYRPGFRPRPSGAHPLPGFFFQSTRTGFSSTTQGRPYMFSASIKGSGSNSSTLNTPGFFHVPFITSMAPIMAGTPVV